MGGNVTFIIKFDFTFKHLAIDSVLSAFSSAQVKHSLSGTAIYTRFGKSSYRHHRAHTSPPNKEIN